MSDPIQLQKKANLATKTRDFLLKPFGGGALNPADALKEYEQFGHRVELIKNRFQRDQKFQVNDVPLMMQDPIVSACFQSMMETAFQPTANQKLVIAMSRYSKIADELNSWFADVVMDDMVLTIGTNVGLYGNLPIRMIYDSKMRLERFLPVPDFTSVTPVVISNRVIGFYVDGNYYDYHNYVYAQYLHYRDLGGIRNPLYSMPVISSLGSGPQQGDGPGLDLVNEFAYAPSYLSPAVRPWRNVRMIEDVLMLQRMDQANFLRIVGVNVGDSVTSKTALRLLSFYRGIFKHARRVPFDEYGMSSPSFGNEFEVVVPQTAKQGLDIKDLGGQIDVKALRDLDVQYQRLFTSLRTHPTLVGFTEDTPSSLGEGPTTIWQQNHARTAKVFGYSTIRAIKQISIFYLRSRGYDVTQDDFELNLTAASTVEEESRRKVVTAGLDMIDKAFTTMNNTGVPYNKKYLLQTLIPQTFATSPIDTARLFDVEDQMLPVPEVDGNGQPIMSSLLPEDLIGRAVIMLTTNIINKDSFSTYVKSIQDQKSASKIITSAEAEIGNISSPKLLVDVKLKRRTLSFEEYLNSSEPGQSGDTLVDLTTLVGTVVVETPPSTADRFLHSSRTGSRIRILPVAISSVQKTLSVDKLSQGSIGEIGEAVIVNGALYFPIDSDLVDYLYSASSGMTEVVVKNLYTETKV